jgi:GAF domain-containing protein
MNVQTRTQHPFGDDETELPGLIAGLAAGALDEAMVYESMQRQNAQVSAGISPYGTTTACHGPENSST